MSFKRTQDDCTMFHNHLVTLKKFLALTLNPVKVTVVRSVCLMLVLCGMLVHAGLASRAVGWPLVFFSSGYAITGLSTIRKFNCFFAQRFWLFYLRWNVMAMVSQKHFENLINCVICYAVRLYWFFPFWQNRKGFRLLLSLRQKPYFLIRFMLQAHKDKHTHTHTSAHSLWVVKARWDNRTTKCISVYVHSTFINDCYFFFIHKTSASKHWLPWQLLDTPKTFSLSRPTQ